MPGNHGELPPMILKTFEQQATRKLATSQVLRLQKILVPIDFSAASNNAFEYALRLGEEFGGQLTLLHVVPSEPLTRCGEHKREIPVMESARPESFVR